MLSDFFRINLPYGLVRNNKGRWMAFNRDFLPIGVNKKASLKSSLYSIIENLPVYTNYYGLTEEILLSISVHDSQTIERDENGEIKGIWLYNDLTNPINKSGKDSIYWDKYWHKLEILSKLEAL